MYNLYWGDLHSHSSASYGHGTAAQALARARQQLDFCSVTGHAFWPDMPTDRDTYAEIIDYHNQGFARLAKNWEDLLRQNAQASESGRFIAFPSYEWHSLKYGDHNVYAPTLKSPLTNAPDLPALRKVANEFGCLAIPHHIGYAAGYRGIDWQYYKEDCSPFVEIYSMHGCSLGEYAAYPMLHDMGPRDWGSTAEAGWALGHRFGIVGGTDHHSAYPGSHGDGRMGVFAEELTRESLWEAFCKRRVYAATGDSIDARMLLDDAWIGESVKNPGTRNLRIAVRGLDAVDKVELLKNGRVLQRFFPTPSTDSSEKAQTYRLRVTWGWGRKQESAKWNGRLTLSDGEIRDVTPCFAGQAVVSPKIKGERAKATDEQDVPHAILDQDARSCSWRSITSGNITVRHATTQAMSLELNAPLDATVTVEVNDQKYQHKLSELLHAGRSHYLRGWLTEAIRIGPLVPEEDLTVEAEITDEPDQETDIYRLQVAQHNGQWAWLSPIWVDK